ncbi:MAG TPA: right-handed parallel beta-helix repeat-containing protein [Thermoanaerobaculia bacterium]|nr:right-handed parallel beta-helix repeat-containing protein [Thermoanaerobaculia bacterium]
MPRTLVPLFLSLLLALPLAAQNADLALKLTPDARYNGGETATVKATVTNLGPDTATAAGVRLAKVSPRFVGASQFGCIEFPDAILCNMTELKAGESHDFLVPFAPPDEAGTTTLTGRTESFTVDPNHDNDSASASADVVSMTDLQLTLSNDFGFRSQQASSIFLLVRNKAARRPEFVDLFVSFPESIEVTKNNYPLCKEVEGSSPKTYRCTFPQFVRDSAASLRFEFVVKQSGPPVTITASVESAEPEWMPADDRASLTQPVYDVPDLDIRVTSPDTLDAENRTTPEFSFANNSDFPATNISAEIITFPAEPNAANVSAGWSCAPSSLYRMLCTTASIAPHTTSVLRVPVQFSVHELRGGWGANVTQKPAPEFRMLAQRVLVDAVFYRPFRVTNGSDSGPGSLRQAILDANAACNSDDGNPPCSIRFNLIQPDPAQPFFTIVPRSPLPRITVTDLLIDGEAQTALTGNSNPAGPEIFLSGEAAGDADGLDLNASAAVVRGLAIGNFARNGIWLNRHELAFASRHSIIERNYLGTDPTGSVAAPNGWRGFMASGFSGEITNNVLSGNRRSGIFLTGFSAATIRDNRIGVAATSDAQLGNGASGIFIGQSQAVIENNVIANGIDFGVAIARDARVEVRENRIFGNVQPGIDFGLDGPSIDGAPRILSARFDAASGETIIEGVIERKPINFALVTLTAYVYANTRDEAGGELFLGTAHVDTTQHFTLRYRGDLTGKFLDAMCIQITDFGDLVIRESSEFGPRTRM